jgi:hypothetical protein
MRIRKGIGRRRVYCRVCQKMLKHRTHHKMFTKAVKYAQEPPQKAKEAIGEVVIRIVIERVM